MSERQPRSDEDRARSHRNQGRPADVPEGKESEQRNPSRSNMDRPIEGRSATEDEKHKDRED
jgi:hypothetical protein